MKSRAKRKIKDFPKNKRPRERLLKIGPQNLTNAELLAIILSSGNKQQNVLSLAKTIFKKFPLKKLAQTKVSELTKIKGIGLVQAGKIIAASELASRITKKALPRKLITPKDVLREVENIRGKSREYLVALYLNARYEALKKQTITIGNLNQNFVEPRDVFGPALSLPCAFVILAHNHPSEDARPSADDKKLTQTLKKAGRLLGVKLVDHLILTKTDYFSFREAKLL